MLHLGFDHLKKVGKTISRKAAPLDSTATERTKINYFPERQKPEPVQVKAPAFTAIASRLNPSAVTKAQPQPTPTASPEIEQPEQIDTATIQIQSALAGIMAAITVLQSSVTALNSRIDGVCSTLEQSKVTTAAIAPKVSKLEKPTLTAEQIEQEKIRQDIAALDRANNAKLIRTMRATGGYQARTGVRVL